MKKIFIINSIIMICWTFCFAAEVKQNKVIKVQLGHNFTVTLASNATTGYQWQPAQPFDKGVIKLIKAEYIYQGQPGIVGRGGKQVWLFKALKEGQTAISFKYVREWEKDVPPASEESFIILIMK